VPERAEPATKPVPTPDKATQGFWDSLKNDRKLAIQHCGTCGIYQHFPQPSCAQCGSDAALTYRPVSGRGEVYSFVITYQTRIKGLAEDVPFVIAWVELPEQKALRVVANVLHCDVDTVHVGMPVRLFLEERGGWVLPQFEPVTS
jgi:uncharacterized OB-fold protein